MNKYIWGSLILIIISFFGIRWIMNNSQIITSPEEVREEAINAIYPTTKKETGKTSEPTGMVVGQAPNKGGIIEGENQEQTLFESKFSEDRKLYIENEYSGTRYVLWRADSKITVHAGSSWSWVHPRRDLTETGVISGQKTFTYEIGSQKIVDFVSGSKKYTIQCVHNGYSEVKAECELFISNFKLL